MSKRLSEPILKIGNIRIKGFVSFESKNPSSPNHYIPGDPAIKINESHFDQIHQHNARYLAWLNQEYPSKKEPSVEIDPPDTYDDTFPIQPGAYVVYTNSDGSVLEPFEARLDEQNSKLMVVGYDDLENEYVTLLSFGVRLLIGGDRLQAFESLSDAWDYVEEKQIRLYRETISSRRKTNHP